MHVGGALPSPFQMNELRLSHEAFWLGLTDSQLGRLKSQDPQPGCRQLRALLPSQCYLPLFGDAVCCQKASMAGCIRGMFHAVWIESRGSQGQVPFVPSYRATPLYSFIGNRLAVRRSSLPILVKSTEGQRGKVSCPSIDRTGTRF